MIQRHPVSGGREDARPPDQSTLDEQRQHDGLEALRLALGHFADERDWGQFHTPKNLVMALVGEVGELVEHFQWLTPEQSTEAVRNPENAEAISEELADVLIYLVRLADVLGVDLLAAADQKLAKNRQRYPPDRVKGSADKAPPLDPT